LSAPWNPDNDIEDLWLRIRNAQVLASIAHKPIKDAATICLMLLSLEASGVFDFATKTMDSFKEHFIPEDKEHKRKLTTTTGGFHGANAASSSWYPAYNNACHPRQRNQDVYYWCWWLDGLSKNSHHTSPICNFKKDGHIDTATADNLQGGSNVIGTGHPRRNCPPSVPRSGAPGT
jgi:hypothetical protein